MALGQERIGQIEKGIGPSGETLIDLSAIGLPDRGILHVSTAPSFARSSRENGTLFGRPLQPWAAIRLSPPPTRRMIALMPVPMIRYPINNGYIFNLYALRLPVLMTGPI